jgi:hypothetical protein
MKASIAILKPYMGTDVWGDFGPWTIYRGKDGRAVWFLRAPPKKPPTAAVQYQRLRMKAVASWWAESPEDFKQEWRDLAVRCGARLTGFNLYVWYHLTSDLQTLTTLARQANIELTHLLYHAQPI